LTGVIIDNLIPYEVQTEAATDLPV
jgi:hypothetical protein